MLAAMKSQATTVDAYLAELPENRRTVLAALRAIIRQHASAGVEERIQYGMPAYFRGDEMLLAFAAQKNYLALYGCGGVFDRFRADLAGLNCGKGCLRFRDEQELPPALAERLIAAALRAHSAAAG